MEPRDCVRTLAGVLLLAGSLVLLDVASAAAFSSGPPDGYAGDPPAFDTCIACHGSFPLNSGPGLLTIAGLPAAYAAGQAYPLTISIQQEGQRRWGFETTVIREDDGNEAGALTPVDVALVQLSEGPGTVRDYLKQTGAGSYAGQFDAASWQILWTAPAAGAGDAHFYLTANAANNNGLTGGDYVYAIDHLVPEAPDPALVDELMASSGLPISDLRAWPNPVLDAGSISFRLADRSEVRVWLFDAGGRLVRRLSDGPMDAGHHRLVWDGLDRHGFPVSNGLYLCRVEAGSRSLTRKILIHR